MSLRNQRSLPVEAISQQDGGLLRSEISAFPTAISDFIKALLNNQRIFNNVR